MARTDQIGFNAREAAEYIGLGTDADAIRTFKNARKRGDIPEPHMRLLKVDLWARADLNELFPQTSADTGKGAINPWDRKRRS